MRVRNRAGFALAVASAMLSLPSIAVAGPLLPFSTSEISQYLMIGTGNDQTGDAITVQRTELGAISEFVSDNDPNLRDVFDSPPDKLRWNGSNKPGGGTNTTYSPPLPPSAPVGVGIDFSGNNAITSETGGFSYSNVNVYAEGFAVRCASNVGTATGACQDNATSNSPWITSAGNQGLIDNGAGVVTHNHNALIAELEAAWVAIDSYTAEFVITSDLVNGFGDLDPNTPGIQTMEDLDTAVNGVGLLVIDIAVDGDFDVNNFDWILDGSGETFTIFRVRGNTNMILSNSSIALGPSGTGGGGPNQPVRDLGAIFVQYEEPVGNTDAVFHMDNVILNGVGFWDLNAFRGGVYDDTVNTTLTVNNGQGCSQFISSSVDHDDVRWIRCDENGVSVPEPGMLSLVGLGLAAAAVRRRRNRQNLEQ